jgi:hypothetical protein
VVKRWRKAIHGKMSLLVILLTLVSAVWGCTGVPTGPRDEAIRAYDYGGSKEEVFLRTPKLTPAVVGAGDTLTQEVPFAVLGPQKGTTFKVLEIVTMSGGGMFMELSRKDSEKAQGVHTSNVQLVIPKDLPPGSYMLITTIIANGMERRQAGSFVVKGR